MHTRQDAAPRTKLTRGTVAGLVAAAGLAAFAAAPATAGSSEPVRKTVKVIDDYFSPATLTVPKGSTIVWKWDKDNGNTHDVKLVSKPKRARRFHSDPASAGARFPRTLGRRGTYKVLCTYHRLFMRQTITVKWPPEPPAAAPAAAQPWRGSFGSGSAVAWTPRPASAPSCRSPSG